ncbi:MAG: hypothetical protein JWQ29_1028 [Phenylobacterium sp.]|nr:hypothetical protein [Phenylobacterium sp.]
MSVSDSTSARLRAVAGLIAAPAAWAVHHQLGADLNFADCHRGDGAVAMAVGAAALAVALVGGFLSWPVWRDRGGLEGPPGAANRFIAALSLLTSGLFSLTIAVQIMAAIVLPACFR